MFLQRLFICLTANTLFFLFRNRNQTVILLSFLSGGTWNYNISYRFTYNALRSGFRTVDQKHILGLNRQNGIKELKNFVSNE